MSPKTNFRILLSAATLLEIAGGALSMVGDHWLPLELQSYLNSRSDVLISPALAGIIAAAGLVVAVVTVFGLFVFWGPSRYLAMLLWVVGCAIAPLLGPTVESCWVSLCGELSAGAFGAVIALSFFSPVRDVFNKKEQLV